MITEEVVGIEQASAPLYLYRKFLWTKLSLKQIFRALTLLKRYQGSVGGFPSTRTLPLVSKLAPL